MKKTISLKSESLKDIRTITGSALMIALAVIIDFFRIVFSNIMEISFSFLALALTGMLYGPLIGGVVGGVSDIIQYIVRPSGPFFPGFTLNNILSGVIFGLFLYKQKLTVKRITICVLIEGIITVLILTPIWLNILYGAKLFAIPRLIRFIVCFILISVIAVLYFTNIKWVINSGIPDVLAMLLGGLIGGIFGYCISGLGMFIPKYFKLTKEIKNNDE